MDKKSLAQLFKEHPYKTIAVAAFLVIMIAARPAEMWDSAPWGW